MVEDSMLSVAQAKRALKSTRYNLLFASNGADALATVRANDIDLILLDIEMPMLDGHETLECLRMDHETRHIPVVIITSRRDEQSRIRSLELGANDHLNKPLSKTDLLSLLGRADIRLRKG